MGGIKLLVCQEDAEAATKLLDESTPEKFEVEGTGEYVQPRCPQCNSLDVTLDGLDKRASYASFFLNLPIPITRKGWKCHACGHTWEDKSLHEQAVPGAGDPRKSK